MTNSPQRDLAANPDSAAGAAAGSTSNETNNSDGWKKTLRSLRPLYEADKHEYYVELLRNEILSTTPPRNVAIAGAYGSGKSSVLAGLRAELERRDFRIVEISLATLNQSKRALLEVSGEATLSAAIQKEVVKRLLYSAAPSSLPRSRFDRIAGLRWGPASGLALVIASLIIGITVMFRKQTPFASVSPGWNKVDLFGRVWNLQWSGRAIDWLLIGILALVAQWAFSSSRVREISLGSAKLTIDDKGGNYFDKYLDEIVYFFQKTKTRVVVFEDLDRFNDPGIFQALRELNILLNGSEQVKTKVTFVHAIRDSLFEKAITSGADGVDSENNNGPVSVRRATDALARIGTDSAASDRAKFFDLVVPLVPFISHEVSADLMVTAFEGIPEDRQPSRKLMALAGRYITDMRVIHSIRNEYVVFVSELLDKATVEGLLTDQLFAMVLYKHHYLDDFERIRIGESKLDTLMTTVAEIVQKRLAALEVEIASAENDMEAAHAVDQRARTAGTRLTKELQYASRMSPRTYPAQSVALGGGGTYDMEGLKTRQFWEDLSQTTEAPISIVNSQGQQFSIDPSDFPRVFGKDYPPERWLKTEVDALRARKDRLTAEHEGLMTAPLAARVNGNYPGATEGHEDATSILASCEGIVRDGLALDLVRGGYIDENFALYTTQFHGEIVSAEARTYLMQCVDRHRNEPLFVLSPDDVDQIIDRTAGDVLRHRSALNVSIFDRLMDDAALDETLDFLITEPAASVEDFFITYLNEGEHREHFIERMAARWAALLDVLAGTTRISDSKRREYLSHALGVMSLEVDYLLSDSTIDMLTREINGLPVLQRSLDEAAAKALAHVILQSGVKIAALASVPDPLKGLLGERGAFAVSRENLQALVPGGAGIGLDSLVDVSDDLAAYVMSQAEAYEAAVMQAPARNTLDDSDRLAEAIEFVASRDVEALEMLIRLAPEDALIVDLNDVPASAFPTLAGCQRFSLTAGNVDVYLNEAGGIDERLMEFFAARGAVEVDDEVAEDTRQRIAELIVSSPGLSNSVKVSLVASLGTRATLDVSRVTFTDGALLAELIKRGEVSDSSATFNALQGGTWEVFEAGAAASNHFVSFVHEVNFNDETLGRLFTSSAITDDVRQAVSDQFDVFASVFGKQSARAFLDYALRQRVKLTSGQLTALAGQGAGSADIVTYLSRQHTHLADAELVALLASLAPPYSALATANGATLTLPYSDEYRAVLKRLEGAGLVKSFRKTNFKDNFKVIMR